MWFMLQTRVNMNPSNLSSTFYLQITKNSSQSFNWFHMFTCMLWGAKRAAPSIWIKKLNMHILTKGKVCMPSLWYTIRKEETMNLLFLFHYLITPLSNLVAIMVITKIRMHSMVSARSRERKKVGIWKIKRKTLWQFLKVFFKCRALLRVYLKHHYLNILYYWT